MGAELGGSASLREQARSNFTATMKDVASIYRPGTPTPTSDFGTTTTFALLETVPASYWSVSGNEAVQLQRMDVAASIIVSLPHDTALTEHDQIVLTEGETGRVHHFDVSFVFDRSKGLTLRAACTEYKFG